MIVRAASANAAVLDGHDEPTLLRIRTLLDAAIDETKSSVAVTQLSHPVHLLGSMLEALGEAKVLSNYGDVAHKIVAKYRYTGSLLKELGEAPELTKTWLAKLKNEAGSSTFDVANRFAANIPDLDDQLPNLITPKDAFQLIVAVCDAADTGAFTSRDLRAGKFSAVPKLKALALKFSEKSPSSAVKIIEDASVGDDLEEFVNSYLVDEAC